MKMITLFFSFAVLAFSVADCGELSVTVMPLKESYIKSEPVSIKIEIRNTSNREIQLPAFVFPYLPDFKFLCLKDGDEAVANTVNPITMAARNEVIAPNESKSFVTFLPRYLRVGGVGKYSVSWSYSGVISFTDKSAPSHFLHEGKFSFSIRRGAFDANEYLHNISEGKLSGCVMAKYEVLECLNYLNLTDGTICFENLEGWYGYEDEVAELILQWQPSSRNLSVIRRLLMRAISTEHRERLYEMLVDNQGMTSEFLVSQMQSDFRNIFVSFISGMARGRRGEKYKPILAAIGEMTEKSAGAPKHSK